MRWLWSVLLLAWVSVATAADVDFNRDVRPILSARCFKCHGPDDAARKAKLRLDTAEGAAAGGSSGEPAIVPGKPDQSELVRRIFADNETEVMPPPAVKAPLTEREKTILKDWVANGARYEPHWAFAPVTRPAVPVLRDPQASIHNPIDNFIQARLEREGLKPSAPADRYTLIRRVYLDLIGILPTPEEVDAFLKDTAPDAYEKVVDRLLASPHYGERWARKWLDLARYADTNGYEKDRPRSIWPYRDWVIRALNDDLPFDQFTIEQLAGDMLPNATLRQRVATGFHRNTMLNEEGGIDPLEFRYYAIVDRVNVTATTWLGLTLGCAQCHTHKFDPFTQTEYFRLFAMLNNADEPELPVPTPEQQKRREQLTAQIRTLEAELPTRLGAFRTLGAFTRWLTENRRRAVPWIVLQPKTLEGGLTRLTVQPDGSILASGDTTKRDLYTLTFENLPEAITAVRLEALPDDSLPAAGPGRTYYEGAKGDFFLSEFTLTADGQPVKFTHASHPNAASAIDGNPLTGWTANNQFATRSVTVFTPARPITARSAKLELLFERYYASSLGRFRLAVATQQSGVKPTDLPHEVEAALVRPPEDRTAAEWTTLFRHWLSVADHLKPAREQIEALRKQLPVPATTLVLQERPAENPRPTFRHHRGEFLQPREPVQPGVPAVLSPLPPGVPANRLTLARWLVSRENPLTARVTVNRHWHAFFGRGLVRTLDDFGYQGEAPTHPELLDWLAVEFMEPSVAASQAGSGLPWSVKRLHKLIVLSATYRQASLVSPELLAKDPENKLLARGPRVRLEAEQIRDSALKAAGLLSAKMYGPSVFPPQPPSVTTEGTYGGFNWKVSDGEDRYRRGLYTFAKRTAPYAMASTFDAPSGEACVARREVTNTALQALTMLNDAVFLDVAQSLARRVMAHPGKTPDRLTWLFRLCLVRPPTAAELNRLTRFYEDQRVRFALDPDRADAVAGRGPDTPERAAWTLTARALLNTDEFVTKE
jgi:hypothetical protein